MKKIIIFILALSLTAALMITAGFAEDWTSEIPHIGEYPLSDTSEGHVTPEGVAAGYWMHPFVIGAYIDVTFDSPVWMNGFRFFAWAPYCDTYLDIELRDAKDNVVWTGRAVCYDNNFQEVAFDKSYPPGLYTISFINAENPSYPDGINQHFVLGSGAVRDDLDEEDIEVTGEISASNSLGAPEIILYEGEPDPDYVTPTPKPTPTPEPDPTEAPDPTDAPEEPTKAPEEPTKAPDGDTANEPAADSGKKGGCGSVIGGFALITLAAAAMVIRKKF